MVRPDFYAALGRRVRDQRKLASMTQADLSNAVGLSRASIANIETGRQAILLHTLYDLAKAIRVSPARLAPPLVLRDYLQLAALSTPQPKGETE